MRLLMVVALVAGCGDDIQPEDGGEPADLSQADVAADDLALPPNSLKVPVTIRDKVDVLFVIDDSPSMAPKQAELQARLPELIKILDDFGVDAPAHYHIGVITSDLGAGAFTLGGGQCKPGGKGGKLQALGADAPMGCLPPTGGVNFIWYNQLMRDGAGKPTTNLPPAQNDLAATFGCMAAVGQKGCGFEQSLEAAYRALHDMPVENHDFLRPDAVLLVVFLTDEDDCSADDTSDLFDPSKGAEYGALNSYRCTRFGVQCGNPAMLPPYADSNGVLTQCNFASTANGGKLHQASRYLQLFGQSLAMGGLKVVPDDIILASISATPLPSDGIRVLMANPNPNPPGPYVPCAGPLSATCAIVLDHGCINPTNNAFFGDPAIRMHRVVSAIKQHVESSVCDPSYTSAMQKIGNILTTKRSGACVPGVMPDPAKPDCTVRVDGVTLKQCSSTVGKPCWRTSVQAGCSSISPQSLALVIERDPPLSSGSQVEASCVAFAL